MRFLKYRGLQMARKKETSIIENKLDKQKEICMRKLCSPRLLHRKTKISRRVSDVFGRRNMSITNSRSSTSSLTNSYTHKIPITLQYGTLNIVGFFFKQSRKLATSPSPALGCSWLYEKLPANRSDCTLALR